MDNTKFNLVSIVLFVVLVGLGVLAFFTLTPPKRYSAKQQDKLVAQEQVAINDVQGTVVQTPDQTQTPSEVSPTTTINSQYADLIKRLQGLIDDKIFMKVGSNGTRVGTVQEFLNIYLKTSKTVDNDFGPGTKTDVMKFQKDQGLTADGQPGPGTYQKMIDFLNK